MDEILEESPRRGPALQDDVCVHGKDVQEHDDNPQAPDEKEPSSVGTCLQLRKSADIRKNEISFFGKYILQGTGFALNLAKNSRHPEYASPLRTKEDLQRFPWHDDVSVDVLSQNFSKESQIAEGAV